MGLKNFSAQDLTSANLSVLISDLRRSITDGDYKTVGDFAKDFAAFASGAELTVTPDGRRALKVGEGYVDFDKVVAALMQPINEAKNPSAVMITDDATRTKYYEMFARVDESLSGLFKQKEMMQELADRGFDPAEFEKRVKEANRESEIKISKYNTQIKRLTKTREDILGEDDPILGKKSVRTELLELKTAKNFLTSIHDQLKEIENLETQVKKMEQDKADKKIAADLVDGHIAAAKQRVGELKVNITGAVQSIKGYGISDIDLADVEGAIAEPATKTMAEAQTVANKFLNGDGSIPSMDTRIQKRYEEFAKDIVKKDKGLDAGVKAKLTASPVDPKDIEAYVADLDKKLEDVKKAKKTEEILQVTREASAKGFRERIDKHNDLEAKLDYVQAKDADGNLLYVDADGNVTTTAAGNQPQLAKEQAKDSSGNLLYKTADGAITTEERDADGNANAPIMVPVMVAKDKAALLTDFDEAAKKTEIANSMEIKSMQIAVVDSLTFSERRALLKKIGRGGPVSRFFRALFKLDASDPAIRGAVDEPAIDTKKTELLNAAKESHVEAKTKPMVEEFLANAPEVKGIDIMFEAEKRKAAVQERMQDGAFEVARKHEATNPELIKALGDASMESLSILYASQVLGTEHIKSLLSAKSISVEDRDIEEAVKGETLGKIVDKTTRKLSDPVIDNPNSPKHTDFER